MTHDTYTVLNKLAFLLIHYISNDYHVGQSSPTLGHGLLLNDGL